MQNKITFIINGKIKHYWQIISQVKEIFNAGDVSFHISEYAGHSIQLSATVLKEGASHIIAIGGDGTLNEVVNGAMDAKNKGWVSENDWNNIRIGILPKGSGNDFSKTIGVTYNLELLKQLIEADSFKEIDLGLANYLSPAGETTNRYFINITDIGIGGVIAHKLSRSSKFLGATLTYQWTIITSLIGYSNQLVKAKGDSFEYTGKIMNFIVANGKYFGAGLGIAPDALPGDGLFSIVVVGDISILDYLLNLGSIRKCIKVQHPELKYYSAKEIYIESTAQPMPIDMDGEFIGHSPLKITMIPKAIKFIA